jgi:hypothetical protein
MPNELELPIDEEMTVESELLQEPTLQENDESQRPDIPEELTSCRYATA